MRDRYSPQAATEHMVSSSEAAASHAETGGSHDSDIAMATPMGVTTVAPASWIGGWPIRIIMAHLCLMVHMTFTRDGDGRDRCLWRDPASLEEEN
jgi:hypothetical protein